MLFIIEIGSYMKGKGNNIRNPKLSSFSQYARISSWNVTLLYRFRNRNIGFLVKTEEAYNSFLQIISFTFSTKTGIYLTKNSKLSVQSKGSFLKVLFLLCHLNIYRSKNNNAVITSKFNNPQVI